MTEGITKDQARLMMIDQLAIYEREVVNPRHDETTRNQEEMRRMTVNQTSTLRDIQGRVNSLYANGSGGPPGAVERLEDSLEEAKNEAKTVRKIAESTKEEMREKYSYVKGYLACLFGAGLVLATLIGWALTYFKK